MSSRAWRLLRANLHLFAGERTGSLAGLSDCQELPRQRLPCRDRENVACQESQEWRLRIPRVMKYTECWLQPTRPIMASYRPLRKNSRQDLIPETLNKALIRTEAACGDCIAEGSVIKFSEQEIKENFIRPVNLQRVNNDRFLNRIF